VEFKLRLQSDCPGTAPIPRITAAAIVPGP
jgi:hypothetical protein